MRKLIKEDHPLLRHRCDLFNFRNPQMETDQLHDVLLECMVHYDGIGLSANQIGYPYKVFAMNHEGNAMVIYNPRVVETSTEDVGMEEGCLTYPGLYVNIRRPKSLSLQWWDKDNEKYQGYFSDLSARVILHEMDHMLGKVFYEGKSEYAMRQAQQKRKIHLREMKKRKHVLYQSYIENKEK